MKETSFDKVVAGELHLHFSHTHTHTSLSVSHTHTELPLGKNTKPRAWDYINLQQTLCREGQSQRWRGKWLKIPAFYRKLLMLFRLEEKLTMEGHDGTLQNYDRCSEGEQKNGPLSSIVLEIKISF